MRHHTGKLTKRTQRLLGVIKMKGFRGATSLEVSRVCGTVSAATDASDLRRCGFSVECSFERMSDEGRRVYRYRLVEEG
jgi:hypothetical protein